MRLPVRLKYLLTAREVDRVFYHRPRLILGIVKGLYCNHQGLQVKYKGFYADWIKE